MVSGAVNPNGRSPSGLRRATAAIAAAAALVTAALALVSLDPTAVCVLPSLALGALLALRRYPGERILTGLGDRRRERRHRRIASVSFAGREQCVPRGGLLLACALAVRPPPCGSRAARLTLA